MQRFFIKYRDFFVYTIFGFLGSLVNIGVYWLFRHIWIWPYLIANIIAYVVANLFGFWANKSLVFKSKFTTFSAFFQELLAFFFFRSLSFFLDNGIMILGISILGWASMPVKIIDQILVGIVNYVTTSYTFKRDAKKMRIRQQLLQRYRLRKNKQ